MRRMFGRVKSNGRKRERKKQVPVERENVITRLRRTRRRLPRMFLMFVIVVTFLVFRIFLSLSWLYYTTLNRICQYFFEKKMHKFKGRSLCKIPIDKLENIWYNYNGKDAITIVNEILTRRTYVLLIFLS